MRFKKKTITKYIFCIAFFALFVSCQQETPITSVIHVDGEGVLQEVNSNMYGLSLEEINHAIDGGLYAEMIQNRSFEDGVPPLNCPYDFRRNILRTPNGYDLPFIRPDSIPGWKALSTSTWLYLDTKELLNAKNHRSLLVGISAYSGQRGGVVAEGYNGISIREGESYNLSFYVKGASFLPKKFQVALEDSIGNQRLSDVCTVTTRNEWIRVRHTFHANRSSDKAILTFSSDSSQMFWLDVVSLFPKTWKGRPNGQRADLMEAIAALHPRFIRFPGGAFAEGYTAGTYPVWKETVGNIAERKHFWGVWGYGTTNGMGYHEYLQMCEDLGAEPVYVINSGITNMSRRPRYESITEMDKLVQDALDAIAYANHPADSTLGEMRAKNGHPAPFHLKYVEIGSENYGYEYTKRYNLFREAIQKNWPEVTVISNALVGKRPRSDWRDTHFNGKNSFFLNNSGKYESIRSRYQWENTFVGEFGNMQSLEARTMEAAIGEACFLTVVERHPDLMSRIAYSPVLGHADYTGARLPMLLFNNHQIVPSPSYYMYQMFSEYRGEKVVPSSVDTYMRPHFTSGYASIYMFDNCYTFEDVQINGNPVENGTTLSGGWNVTSPGIIQAIPNRWNYLLMGDSTAADYCFEAKIKRVKGSEPIQFRIRNNGFQREQQDYICFTIGNGKAALFHQSGNVTDSLSTSSALSLLNNRTYGVKIECSMDSVYCYVDGSLVQKGGMRSYPSLSSVTTIDYTKGYLYLKVVNTTQHEEKTELDIHGISVDNKAEIIELAGEMESTNTFEQPDRIKPQMKEVSFMIGIPKVYKFPPSSITIMKFKIYP